MKPSLDRRLAMDAFAALPATHQMVGLLELDVTDALAAIEALRQRGERVSLFAFVVRCIAVAIAEHPDLNLVRHGKRRLVRFEDVDVAVPIEVEAGGTKVPKQAVIRRAQERSVQQIYAELVEARRRHEATGITGAEDRRAHASIRAIRWLPRFLRLAIVRWVMRSAFRIKSWGGTTLVTSVGKFSAASGFVFSFTTGPRAAAFTIGSVVDKPWVREGRVVPRTILSMSIMVDHDLVDGGPAARFAARLQALVESAAGL